jgi:hypothetical protein
VTRARVRGRLASATVGAALAAGTVLLGAPTAQAQPNPPVPVFYPPDPIRPIAGDDLAFWPPDPIRPIAGDDLAFWPPGPIRPIIPDNLPFFPPDPIQPGDGDGGGSGGGGGGGTSS